MKEAGLKSLYSAPPIIEALIQIRFADAMPEALRRKTVKRLTREYSNASEQEKVGASIDFQKRNAEFDAKPQTRLASSDQSNVLAVLPNSLTWTRLAPYQGWDAFTERVKLEAEMAQKIAGYRKIERLGVRYINRIDVPNQNGLIHYEDFLDINISLPKKWDLVENYAWRFERKFPDRGLMAVVQSAVIPPEIPDHGAFLLDIDVIADQNLPTKLEDTFQRLNTMRDLKNEIFEISISDTARKSFSS